ncbi:hypothetical protein L9F63_011902 [Diploptera punctata]|uniref:TRAF3-interacting protein 1 n=1 Tax=Diploptera punctata TaxID=6984 RepID=A0AAD8ADN1_DIPPU|nr:hypothetical protein L9F63_011902 [Diploptera punctata]
MGDEIKPEIIKNTQDSLGKYIKKPPLTEKLLKKPPFRFLHDIVTAVIRETGFLQGLFSAEELNHENIKDRDGKVAFLQKLIDAVKSVTGTNLTVRPTKIVAGHEPAKTNELLQTIGKALDKKLSSQAYVESLQKKGKKPSKPATKEFTSDSKYSKTITQARGHSQDRAKGRESDKKKSVTKTSNDATVKTSKSKTEISREKTKKSTQPPVVQAPKPGTVQSDEPKEETEPNKLEEKRPQSARPGNRRQSANLLDRSNNEVDAAPDIKDEPSQLPAPTVVPAGPPEPEVAPSEPEKVAPPSPKPEKLISARPRPQTALRPVSARPPSARPAAPRIRDRGEVKVPEDISSSPVTGKVHVITENESITEQEEEDNFVVIETQNAVIIEEPPDLAPSSVETKPAVEGDHGHLVAQILETQKELEDESRLPNQDRQTKKVEIEWESGRHREREVVSREVDRLRSSIQTLTRAANPLGKLMDFLQEDIDSMQRELETWHRTNAALAAELRAEQDQTRNLTEPLKQHLQQLEISVEEQLSQLSTVKATVLRNDERIQRLLTSRETK